MIARLALRHYQAEAVQSLFDYFITNGGNPVVALPTGTGKSYVIAEFVRRCLEMWLPTRILIVTHVKELIEQNFRELIEIWPTAPAGIYSAGLGRRDVHQPVTFCGVQSIAKRVEDFGYIDIVIIDECHLVSDKQDAQYAKVIGLLKLTNPMLKVVGLTATPYRLGMGLLTEGKVFTDICCDWTGLEKFNQLIDEGYICPLIPKRTKTELNVDEVGITHGEFNIDELQAAVDRDWITRAALTEAKTLAAGRWSWLVFCAGVTHANHTRDILNELGIPALCVHTDLDPSLGDGTRDENLARFKRMEVAAICNVGVLTTGFNHKPIDCIVVLRPTMSASLWVQMLGRGTRPCPETYKQNCLVLDFAANTKRLGPINDPVIPRKKGKKGNGGAPFKICPACDVYNHARARFCIGCQYEFPAHLDIDLKAATDELIRKKKEEPAPVVIPIIERFKVDRVEWSKHLSRDYSKPPSLLVTYYCGLRIFNEWLCLEHLGFALHKAHDAWRMMAEHGATESSRGRMALDYEDPGDPPSSIDEALSLVGSLRPPSFIRVLLKPKWPEVVGYEWTEDHSPANGVQEAVDAGLIPF